jgi:uncharacterized protein (DUF58 family)
VQAATSAPSFAFNGVVRLTRVGTAYLIFTVVIGFSALNTGNNPLYIGLAFMLGCLLLSGMASKSGLRHLEVEILDLREAWAARNTPVRIRIANRSRIWNVRDVIIVSDELAEPVFVPVVPRRSSVEVNAMFLFRHRGRVTLKTADFYTRYPFGFFLKKRRVRITGEVVVFPRLLEDRGSQDRFRSFAGEHSTANRIGAGSELHSFREYQRGDSPRQVYWRKSASLGRWIVRQTELESSKVIHVVVDPYKAPAVTDDEFEEMISAAATYIDDALERGVDVVLTLPRNSVRVEQGQSSIPLFRALALLEPVYEPLAAMIDRGTVVFGVRRAREPKSA